MAQRPPDLPLAATAPPARFWARYAAWSLDLACLLPLLALLAGPHMRVAQARAAWHGLMLTMPHMLDQAMASGVPDPNALARQMLADPSLAAGIAGLQSALTGLLLTPLVVYALLALVWSVGFESSAWRATPGKRALGLAVVTQEGARLKPTQALARYFASGLSWLTLNIGHALAMLPPDRLALHDRVSRTRVLALDGDTALPLWAKGWLALQALAFCVAMAWMFIALQSAMQAAMDQALGGL